MAASGLPSIFLGEIPRSERKLPPVYLCETGPDGASCRLKWLASTCLAGMVGVCLIGVAIYASLNMGDGSGMMSSLKRASLAALQPMRTAQLAKDGQSANGQKEDRIQMTAAGFVSRQVIHDTVIERQGSREYITIKPYFRIVAGLATELPTDVDKLPPFNPFKLYSDQTPVGAGGEANDAPQAVSITVIDVPGGILPQSDGVELRQDEVNQLVAEAAENFAYAEGVDVTGALGEGGAQLLQAAYHPEEGLGLAPTPHMTVIQKSAEDAADEEEDEFDDDMFASAESKTVTVGKGDTLASLFTKAGTEPDQANEIIDALAPIFGAKDLKSGQELRFTLVPAPSDTGQMEPIKVSVFAKDSHLATVARNRQGEYVASREAIGNDVKTPASQTRATLYTSFYHASLEQKIPAETILKLLRVHSYDVDFKQKVRPGDTFEMFFDGASDDEVGELLYTSMTIDGHVRKFYRFRTPDDVVDYYDEQGNSAKKFLMRNPVKGGRYTSGFGARNHPLLKYRRMHTGVDWAAPTGTPILAAGDGTVERVGREGGYGNYVRIRHANGFATAYGHMSRYAPGVTPGVSVKQGQIIGFVGSTGLSTGPHCHFEVLVNNSFVNPMTIQVPRGLQLEGRQLAEFQRERKRIEALMQMDPVTSRVAQAN
ncbi:MAG TPA: peptidoglycan DD-metalloendopeptidase family protein [Methyloceanibacter sp.]|nr:peptidoglycan DD-metalloendopeptidase family protein [Methyloceanibacter sp.]